MLELIETSSHTTTSAPIDANDRPIAVGDWIFDDTQKRSGKVLFIAHGSIAYEFCDSEGRLDMETVWARDCVVGRVGG